jgi:hypothetical protein
VGRRLLALDHHIAEAHDQRRQLLAQLRAMHDEARPRPVTEATAARPAPTATAARRAPTAPIATWLRAAGPQALLAGGGVLLLVIAALVFTAVAWRDLPAMVRGGLLAVASAGCGVATHRLTRRGLDRTAEATAVLTVALLAVLVNGLWRAGAFDGVADGAIVLAAGSAALAGVSHGLAGVTRTRSPNVLAAWLAPTAVLASGFRLASAAGTVPFRGADAVVGSVALLAAAAVAVVYAQHYLGRLSRWRTVTQVCGAALWLLAAIATVVLLAGADPALGAERVAFIAGIMIACASTGAALLARSLGDAASLWDPAGAAGAWLMGTSAGAAVLHLPASHWDSARFLIPAAAGAAALRWLSTRRGRGGAAAGMVPVVAIGSLPFLWSLSWLLDVASARSLAPWTTAPATTVVAPPTVAALVLAAVAVAVIAAAAAALDRTDVAIIIGIGGAIVVVVTTGLAAWPTGGGVVAAAAVAAGGAVALQRQVWPAVAALVAATLLAVALGLSSEPATIGALTAAAAAAAVAFGPIVAGQRTTGDAVAATVAALLTADVIGLTAATVAASTHDPGPVGVAVSLAAAGAWVLAGRIGDRRYLSMPVESTAAAGFAAGVGSAALDGTAGWLAVGFAVLAVAAAGSATLRSDRPWMRWVATMAASASSWTVLADRGVDVVEAYTAPPALLILAMGAIALRRRPVVSSWRALGPGLGLLLTPTVVTVLDDPDDLGRLLAVIALGSILAVAGRVWRLQAPLVCGVAALTAVALTQHDIVTDVVPRWALLAAGGSLLLWLSMSYERQLQRVAAVRAGLADMR